MSKEKETTHPAHAPVAAKTKKFNVSLKAPTPLAHNPAVVEAVDGDAAWLEFCKLNGISGSDHPKTITEAE